MMKIRGGRFFNQAGRPAPVGIHTTHNPSWSVESRRNKINQYRIDEPFNTPYSKHISGAIGGEN